MKSLKFHIIFWRHIATSESNMDWSHRVPEGHMGSFPHPTQHFAAAGENDDFVIAVANFQLNQYF